jgi:exodeoxyribonuclease VII small subunit
MSKTKKIRLEDTFKELSDLVYKLENDNVDIDKMIELFKEGMLLTKLCENKLKEAEDKINILLDKNKL